jgi:hypothetical protein
MRFYSLSLFLFSTSSTTVVVDGFAPHARSFPSTSAIYASSSNNNEFSVESAVKNALSSLSGVALAAALWGAPATVAPHLLPLTNNNHNNVIVSSSMANAKEMASGTGSRVNKDPESLLRYGLPIDNKEVRLVEYLLSSFHVMCCAWIDTAVHSHLAVTYHLTTSLVIHLTSGQRTPKVH